MLTHWSHLALGQRRVIANLLAQGAKLRVIAGVVGMDPTSISKEIERNRTKTSDGPDDCPKTKRFPFVCDCCPLKYKRNECRKAHWRYHADHAQSKADARLRGSRSGVDATEEEFKALDEAVKRGVEEGKSVYAISKSPEVAGAASPSKIYRLIAEGKMTVKRADLPKAVKYKKRKKPKYDYGGSSNSGKEGRKYLDYLAYRRKNPGEFAVQMDYLGSIVADEYAVFVCVIPELHFAFGRKLKKGDSPAVARFFDELEEALGLDGFRLVVPAILTDNDPCFSDFLAIEFSKATGERRTRVFYCDPYASNQKASVENMNGQLRRFFPKRGSVDALTDEYVAKAFLAVDSSIVRSLGGESPKTALEAAFGAEVAKAIEGFILG